MSDIESRTIDEVQSSTRFLLKSFNSKISALKDSSHDIRKFLRFGVDYESACMTASKFFGNSPVDYIAIDGTQSIDQKLDLLVFYIGAFAYMGNVKFPENYLVIGDPKPVGGDFSLSTAIPLSEDEATSVYGQPTQSGVEIEIERLPSSLMHLAEYYLAYTTVKENESLRIILLDRTLAGDIGHFNWSVKDLIKSGLSILEGIETSYGVVSNFDLDLARMLLPNADLKIPAPRSHLLKYAAIYHLFGGQTRSLAEIIGELGANQERLSKLSKDFEEFEREFQIFDKVLDYKLKDGVVNSWERVLEAALKVADHVFHPHGEYPLRFKKNDREFWITADDVDLLTLIFISALTRMAWKKNLLLLGLIKDTGAAELVRTVIPLLEFSSKIKLQKELPNFHSDKMLLQTNSVANATDVLTPWHTIDTDAAFKTIAPIHDSKLGKGEARVLGAFRNVIYPERTFVKSYIQMWSSKRNPAVRSHVFSFDRPAYAQYDHWDELLLHNEDSSINEKIRPILHFDRESEMTNLAMAILVKMGEEVVPEALGHNYPLFMADKKAKAILNQTREAYLGAVDLEMSRSGLDQQVLFSSRFRDYRSQIEAKRKT